MALRLHYLFMCTSLLLAVAVSVAVPSLAPSTVPSVVAAASGSCYETFKGVPEWCSQMFITAVFADNKNGITRDCCILLACVRDVTCTDVLRGYCLPPEVDECPGAPKRPPLSRPLAFAPAVTTGAAN